MLSKPVVIGGVAALAALAYLSFSGSSHAAQGPLPPGPGPLPPEPLPPTPLPASSGVAAGSGTPTVLTPADGSLTTFVSSVTGSTLQAPGYAGEGLYEVLAAHGLNIRISPDTRQQPIGTLQQGESCTVIDSPTANGWIPVHNDAVQGYVCLSCAEAPGGPWLAQIAVLGDYALANAAANALGL